MKRRQLLKLIQFVCLFGFCVLLYRYYTREPPKRVDDVYVKKNNAVLLDRGKFYGVPTDGTPIQAY